ncbi:MAG: tetratricopeptide repeat protein [Spirochaetaceae bacterium]|jgi:putative GTP pyrophosphokinase|nr:tetratricopeptide repeat protein [Spirochaetaceae bacterium]
MPINVFLFDRIKQVTMTFPNKAALQKQYEETRECRESITHELVEYVEKNVLASMTHLTVKGRPKSFKSFYKKYLRYLRANPEQDKALIPDQIGVRVVCPFLEDIAVVEEACRKKFSVFEIEQKGSDYSFKEFGYESIHLLVKLPDEIFAKWKNDFVTVAEIQIRTILQDAWAEVEHELVYKTEFTPYDEQMKRKLAAVNAMLFLADTTFQEIRTYQRQFRYELDKRHDSFFKKVEEFTDNTIFREALTGDGNAKDEAFTFPAPVSSRSIDDLLLNALYAHNKGQLDKAISFYSDILSLEPPEKTASIIYKHRGMAYFAQSRYEDAAGDFTLSLNLDPSAYKSIYYRAVVRQVQKNYPAAAEDFSRALSMNAYQPWALYRRAQVFYHIGDYPAALADCESAIALDPDFGEAAKFKTILLSKLKM